MGRPRWEVVFRFDSGMPNNKIYQAPQKKGKKTMAKAKKEKLITHTFNYSEVNVRYVKPNEDTVSNVTIIVPNAAKLDETTLMSIAKDEVKCPVVSAEIANSYTKRFAITEKNFMEYGFEII